MGDWYKTRKTGERVEAHQLGTHEIPGEIGRMFAFVGVNGTVRIEQGGTMHELRKGDWVVENHLTGGYVGIPDGAFHRIFERDHAFDIKANSAEGQIITPNSPKWLQ